MLKWSDLPLWISKLGMPRNCTANASAMRWENDDQTLLGNPIRDKPWALIWSGDNSSRRGVANTWFYRCPFVFFARRRLTLKKTWLCFLQAFKQSFKLPQTTWKEWLLNQLEIEGLPIDCNSWSIFPLASATGWANVYCAACMFFFNWIPCMRSCGKSIWTPISGMFQVIG